MTITPLTGTFDQSALDIVSHREQVAPLYSLSGSTTVSPTNISTASASVPTVTPGSTEQITPIPTVPATITPTGTLP